MKEMKTPRTGRSVLRWAAACAVVVTLGLIAAGVLTAAYQHRVSLPVIIQEKLDLMPDLSAQAGTLPDSGSARSDSFRVVINQMITMEDGASPCAIEVENPMENSCDLRVSLYLKDTGELLGATHRIERGKRVDELKLNTRLAAGTYEVLAVLELFDDSQDPVGQLSVDLSLLVQQ